MVAGMSGFCLFGGLLSTAWVTSTVRHDIEEHNWDWVRLSSLSAWQVLAGTVLGAPLLGWLGAAACLAVALAGAGDELDAAGLASLGFGSAAAALTAHLAAFALGVLGLTRQGPGLARRRSPAFPAAVGLFSLLIYLVGAASYAPERSSGVDWYGLTASSGVFMWSTLVIAAVIAFVAGFRLLRRELQYRQYPAALPALLLGASVYGAGFLLPRGIAGDPAMTLMAYGAALYLGAGVSFVTLLITEAKSPIRWLETARRARAGNWKGALQRLPLAPVAWMMILAGYVLLQTGALIRSADPILAQLQGMTDHKVNLTILASLPLFLLRDFFILQCLGTRKGQPRSDALGLVTLFLLYVLLPWIAKLVGSAAVARTIFFPSQAIWVALVWAAALAVPFVRQVAAAGAKPR
jgi:hypothetical protein